MRVVSSLLVTLIVTSAGVGFVLPLGMKAGTECDPTGLVGRRQSFGRTSNEVPRFDGLATWLKKRQFMVSDSELTSEANGTGSYKVGPGGDGVQIPAQQDGEFPVQGWFPGMPKGWLDIFTKEI